jgi:acyl carrier protein
MQKIIDIVSKKTSKSFSVDDNLIDNHIIDSIDFISIIAEIEQVFDIEIDFLELDPKQITTIKGLWEIVKNELE